MYDGSLTLNFCRCILVDENDRVVGHDTKYNCKQDFIFFAKAIF